MTSCGSNLLLVGFFGSFGLPVHFGVVVSSFHVFCDFCTFDVSEVCSGLLFSGKYLTLRKLFGARSA